MSLPQEDQKVEYARHVQRSTMVEDLSAAFIFCLDAANEEDMRHPAVTIQPVMTYEQDESGATTTKVQFEVSISGPT
jgi:hypothetical protein